MPGAGDDSTAGKPARAPTPATAGPPSGPPPAAAPPPPAPVQASQTGGGKGAETGAARPRRAPRPHPYADEASTDRERALDPRRVALFWVGLATAITLLGLYVAGRLSPVVRGIGAPRDAAAALAALRACLPAGSWGSCLPLGWEFLTEIPLFAGLGLLGFGFVARDWARRLTLAGWLLFASYWALTAQDLFYLENGDYVNMAFALLGTYFFTYLAYHQWLNGVRGVENPTVRFLNVSTFIAAGSYFAIDKIQSIRTWLILTVSDQTEWMLALFGQGAGKSLVYRRDMLDPESPTSFHYADWLHTTPDPHGFWGSVLHFNPLGDDPLILPVSIILACTALQSIMLFVGLFMGTRAPLRKRLVASAVVAVVVYALNLLRNTGIIWFYGEGIMSFWVIHDAIGKGGSLLAMIGIAFASFAWFPEFLRELIGVLDLPHRDGPVERTLRIGRRRPQPPAA